MKKLLILGHSGFIGRAVWKAAAEQFPGAEIRGFSTNEIDLTDLGQARSLSGELTRDAAVVMLSGLKKQRGDNLENFAANLRMVENIARVLEDSPVRRFIYFSSADVYGEDVENTAITETTPVNPRSYYGIAKLSGELVLRKVIEANAAGSLVILRPSFTYGGAADQAGIYGPYEFCRAARDGSEIALWGDGSEQREFLFVEDLARLTACLLSSPRAGVLNPMSGQSHTFSDLLDVIASFDTPPLRVTNRPRSRDKVNNGFENTRLQEWFPEFRFTPLEEGLRRTFDAVPG